MQYPIIRTHKQRTILVNRFSKSPYLFFTQLGDHRLPKGDQSCSP